MLWRESVTLSGDAGSRGWRPKSEAWVRQMDRWTWEAWPPGFKTPSAGRIQAGFRLWPAEMVALLPGVQVSGSWLGGVAPPASAGPCVCEFETVPGTGGPSTHTCTDICCSNSFHCVHSGHIFTLSSLGLVFGFFFILRFCKVNE